jgi:hypothetical protein
VRYYLCGWQLTADGWTPDGCADLDPRTWGCISLRPDPAIGDGWALVGTTETLAPSIRRVMLTDDPDDRASTIRQRLSNRLLVNLTDAPFRQLALALLLEHGDDRSRTRWNRLRPAGWRYEVWLHGDLLVEMPAVSGAFSDDFNRADSTTLGGSWAEVAGNQQILTNTLAAVTASTDEYARWEQNIASADHYSQITAVVAAIASGRRWMPAVRFNSAAHTCYIAGAWGTGAGTSEIRAQVIALGVPTGLGSNVAYNVVDGDVIRTEIQGSTLRCKVNGVLKQSWTDVALATQVRAGVHFRTTSNTTNARVDDWSADILTTIVTGSQAAETDTAGAGAVSAAVAGTLATEADTANAGTLSALIGGAQAAETSTPRAGGPVGAVAGTLASETDTGRAGNAATTVVGQLAAEVDAGFDGSILAAVFGSRAAETDTANGGVARAQNIRGNVAISARAAGATLSTRAAAAALSTTGDS